MVRIRISYGYNIHSILITDKVYDRVRAGKKVETEGQGFFDECDGYVKDFWVFNENPGDIFFYLENGATFPMQEHWIEQP